MEDWKVTLLSNFVKLFFFVSNYFFSRKSFFIYIYVYILHGTQHQAYITWSKWTKDRYNQEFFQAPDKMLETITGTIKLADEKERKL